MKIYMYEHFPNFGDALNSYLWPLYFDKWLHRADNVLMFGIGTLLGQKINHNGRVIVCGSGCGYEADTGAVEKNWKIFFVRGPRTANILGLPAEVAITDPAILTSECFPKSPPSSRVAFIPHWETSANPLWRKACSLADIDYIDPLASVPEVVSAISAAKMVITEAMHGAIIADSYRVPFIPVSTSARINNFKWQDWTESLSINFVIENLSFLGVSDVFRTITADRKTSKYLRKVLPNKSTEVKPEKICWPLSVVNMLYLHAIPLKLRYRVEHYAIWKLGRRIDTLLGKSTDVPLLGRIVRGNIERMADRLRLLGMQSGYQSEQHVFEEKRRMVKEKLYEVQLFLEKQV